MIIACFCHVLRSGQIFRGLSVQKNKIRVFESRAYFLKQICNCRQDIYKTLRSNKENRFTYQNHFFQRGNKKCPITFSRSQCTTNHSHVFKSRFCLPQKIKLTVVKPIFLLSDFSHSSCVSVCLSVCLDTQHLYPTFSRSQCTKSQLLSTFPSCFINKNVLNRRVRILVTPFSNNIFRHQKE